MNANHPSFPVPRPLLAANAFGLALIGAGIVALHSPGGLPAFATDAVAWALLAAGVLIESGSMQGIVIAMRDARGQGAAAGVRSSASGRR